MKFIVIQVLQCVAHTYRHNFESFFYVLLWICVRRDWEREVLCSAIDRPKESILTWWYSGSFKAIAGRFNVLLGEFPSAFDNLKPQCKKIWGILFPLLKDGVLFTGTLLDPPEELYHPIIKAFEDVIEDSKKTAKSRG